MDAQPDVDPWTQAVFATAPVICGKRLLPFSLAHSMLLRAFGNPYGYIGIEGTRTALLDALEVCSRTREQNAARLARFPVWRETWRRVRWGWRSLKIADESFRVYISDFTRRQEYAATEAGEGAPVASPPEIHLHRHMCDVEGMDFWAAWDCPLGLAWACFDAWREWKGQNKAVTAHEAELRTLAARMQEFAAAGDHDGERAVFDQIRELVKAHSEGRAT